MPNVLGTNVGQGPRRPRWEEAAEAVMGRLPFGGSYARYLEFRAAFALALGQAYEEGVRDGGHDLRDEVERLRRLNEGLAERVAAQHELLSRKAEIQP